MEHRASQSFEVTNRSVLAIAIPMTLAYLTTPLLGIVDTAVVGQLGDAALIGGLAAGAIVFDVVFSSLNFLRSGTTGLVAQAFGRADELEEQAVFWRAALLALGLGLLLAIIAPLVAMAGIWFIDAEPRVDETLDLYVRIRLLGTPLSLLNYVILGYVLGRGEGRLGLLLQIVLNSVNIVLCILLGLKLGWGVAGVAWATVIGEVVACAVGLSIILGRFRKVPGMTRQRVLHLADYRTMLALNRDILIRSFSLLAAFALFARQGAQFGTVTLAANAVLMNFFLAAAFFLDGFATAAEQLAGRAVGASNRIAFDRAVRLCAGWGFAMSAVATAILLMWGGTVIDFITTAADVRAMAKEFLPWTAFTAMTAVLAFELDGVFIGATWSSSMRNMMLLSFATFVAAMLILTPIFGNHGLWAALHVFLVARGLSLLAALPHRARQTFQSG